MQIVFITDLDGTLLGHETFAFASIRQEIHDLMDAGIRIVPNSSKTRAEIEVFCDKLGTRLPFICENGAALVNADLLYPEPACAATADARPLLATPVLGKTVDQLMSDWIISIAPSLRDQCLLVDAMTPEAQQALLGLSGDDLERALKRDHSVLFAFNGNRQQFTLLCAQAATAGLRVHRGGRVCCLSAHHDKSSFNAVIRRLCGTPDERVTIIGFGDSDNDIALLCAADVACVVPRMRMPALSLPNPPATVITVPKPAPDGWLMAANRALLAIEQR